MSRPGRPARGALFASVVLLAVVAAFCATTRWGRMYPKAAVATWQVWSKGHALNAAQRRLLFYDETYRVLVFLRQNTPPGAVVVLPPRAFVKSEVASRRAPGEDLIPMMGSASSAYGVIYPRIPVPFDDEIPWKEKATHLLAWDYWGLDLVDPSIQRTEANRVRLFEAPGGSPTAPPPPARHALADDRTTADRWITPALLLGLLVLAALGDGAYRLLGRIQARPETTGPAEAVAWRMLLAPALVPFIAVAYDLAKIPFTQASLSVLALLLVAAGLAWGRPGLRRSGPGDAPGTPSLPAVVRDAWRALGASPAVPVLLAATASLLVMSVIQVAILPERNYDALVGSDLVGKILAAEGQLRSSIYDRIVFNAQSVYPPFTSANNGFGYLFFEAVPRLWVPWLIAGFLLALGTWVRRRTGSPTLAALACFLLFLPQALLSQGLTEARPDLPSMIYTALAALAVADLFRARRGYGAPAMLLLVATAARTENLLCGAALAVACLLARPALPGRGKAAWLVALPAAFFAFWNLFFVKVLIGYDPAAHFTRLDFAPGRMLEIVTRAFRIMAWPQAFGEFIFVVALAPLGWAAWRVYTSRRRGPGGPAVAGAGRGADGTEGEDLAGTLLLLAGLMFVFYLPFFYAWDPVLNPLESMKDTLKRGFFRFMPLLLVAFLALPPVARWLRRCDGAEEPGPAGEIR